MNQLQRTLDIKRFVNHIKQDYILYKNINNHDSCNLSKSKPRQSLLLFLLMIIGEQKMKIEAIVYLFFQVF